MLYFKIDEISSVTPYDLLIIYSSFLYLTEDKFNCDYCWARKAKKDSTRWDKIKRLQGCINGKESPVTKTDTFIYYKCIGSFRDPSINYLITLFESVKVDKNIMELPSKIVELSNLWHNLLSERQKELSNGK